MAPAAAHDRDEVRKTAGLEAEPEFAYFSKLPVEIRHKIWEHSLPEERLFQIPCRAAVAVTQSNSPLRIGGPAKQPPAAMRACREARGVAKRVGRFSFGLDGGNMHGLWFNPDKDLVIYPQGSLDIPHAQVSPDDLRDGLQKHLRCVKHVVVRLKAAAVLNGNSNGPQANAAPWAALLREVLSVMPACQSLVLGLAASRTWDQSDLETADLSLYPVDDSDLVSGTAWKDLQHIIESEWQQSSVLQELGLSRLPKLGAVNLVSRRKILKRKRLDDWSMRVVIEGAM